jgi:hypothetical protein
METVFQKADNLILRRLSVIGIVKNMFQFFRAHLAGLLFPGREEQTRQVKTGI